MEHRANILSEMEICRFCLCEENPLSNIYERQIKDSKQTVPLPLQLMACVAIEVFQNDGMPQKICSSCRTQTLQAYNFKQNSKKADDALKTFLATGSLVKPFTQEEMKTKEEARQAASKRLAHPPSPQRAKKPKTDKNEVVTLNFTNLSNPTDEDSTPSDINFVSVESHAVPSDLTDDQTAADSNDDEDDDNDDPNTDYLALDDSVLNPTLKVSQVKTDCFPCSQCERSFPLKQLLELHKANHTRDRNHVCDECDKAFFTKYDLNKHTLTHTGKKPFSCVACGRAFSRESLLHRHEKTHNDAPKYMCTECERTFLTGDDLDAHMNKHKKQRPFVCKLCNKSFVFKQGLERHEQTHSVFKPHKCNYCEASFNSAIKLTRHVTSHAGLRPYPCKLCGRTFLLSHHLTRHMRNHYAARQQNEVYVPPVGQHKCDICSMSFRRKDSLINHSAIHSMVNLKCVICNTEFDNVKKVKEHITTHLSDLPFPCDKCDYSFETQDQLEDHELKHAEMEYEEQIEQEVLEEARQAAEGSELSGDDIAEFTIMNDLENPEVVRRSRRPQKVKNYAEFLKDELGSDLEEMETEEENGSEGEYVLEEGEVMPGGSGQEEDFIKPIVRTEGTKVYARKSMPEKVKQAPISLNEMNATRMEAERNLETIEHFATDIGKLPDKEIFNMKIGDKTVTVQKRFLTKEQMRAMAKEGKIEVKGNAVLLKKSLGSSSVNLDSIFSSGKDTGKQLKKTYQRKTSTGNGDESEGSSNSQQETILLNESV